jgi:hypothetical protein
VPYDDRRRFRARIAAPAEMRGGMRRNSCACPNRKICGLRAEKYCRTWR